RLFEAGLVEAAVERWQALASRSDTAGLLAKRCISLFESNDSLDFNLRTALSREQTRSVKTLQHQLKPAPLELISLDELDPPQLHNQDEDFELFAPDVTRPKNLQQSAEQGRDNALDLFFGPAQTPAPRAPSPPPLSLVAGPPPSSAPEQDPFDDFFGTSNSPDIFDDLSIEDAARSDDHPVAAADLFKPVSPESEDFPEELPLLPPPSIISEEATVVAPDIPALPTFDFFSSRDQDDAPPRASDLFSTPHPAQERTPSPTSAPSLSDERHPAPHLEAHSPREPSIPSLSPQAREPAGSPLGKAPVARPGTYTGSPRFDDNMLDLENALSLDEMTDDPDPWEDMAADIVALHESSRPPSAAKVPVVERHPTPFNVPSKTPARVRPPIGREPFVPPKLQASEEATGRPISVEVSSPFARSITPVRPPQPIAHNEILTQLEQLVSKGNLLTAYIRAQDQLALSNAPELQSFFDGLHERLLGMAVELLKPLHRIPVLRSSIAEIRSMKNIDHRAGYLLSQIDGSTDLEFLIDLGAMPRAEGSLVLLVLTERGVIQLR
ncbi:MAG: hypothetical protein RBU37_28315, partial [Myxococcota bacterium]|nr:hypothetical protein [Myxococcota bacterium]